MQSNPSKVVIPSEHSESRDLRTDLIDKLQVETLKGEQYGYEFFGHDRDEGADRGH